MFRNDLIQADKLGMLSLLDTYKIDDLPKLKGNQFLLRAKLATGSNIKTAVIGKVVKGEIPPKLSDFYNTRQAIYPARDEVIVFEEKFLEGWRFLRLSKGTYSTQIFFLHPYHFEVKINLNQLQELLLTTKINCGLLEGKFKYIGRKLIKES